MSKVKKQPYMKMLSPKQVEAIVQLSLTEGGDIFWRVGTGKTRLGIMLAVNSSVRVSTPVILVIARRAAFYDWQQEIATLQLDWDVLQIETIKDGWFPEKGTFILVSDGLLLNSSIVATLQSFVRTRPITYLLVDEGWLFMNIMSKRSKALKCIREADTNGVLPTAVLSGSIMPSRELTQIYGQVCAAGKGRELSATQSDFRTEFQLGFQGAFFSRYPRKGAYAEIMRRIQPFTHVHFPLKGDREIKETILKVPPTPTQLAYFKELKETWGIDGKFELSHAPNLIQKAQQISNGWLEDGEGNVEWFTSTKLERTLVLVDEIVNNEKDGRVVIWCAYREDVRRLISEINAANIAPAVPFMSAVKFDAAAWHKPGKKICVATEASGSSVNHFGQVPYGIYFSQDWKWRSLEQSQGRHDRKNSLHDTCYYTFLHTEKSFDSRVFYTVRASRSAEKSFIRQMDVLQWLKGKVDA